LERSFARKIGQVIADFVPSGDDTGDLLDHEQQLDILRWREGHITASVARRFKRGLDEDHDPFEVFRAVQNHAVDAARAHIDRVILEAFLSAIEACDDESLRNALGLTCELYALSLIESERAFFQEHGRLTGPRCKAITREVNRLCNEVRGFAGALVDAFGIPDEVLGAPIGLKDPGQ
jgi:acyl-CoA oxidase